MVSFETPEYTANADALGTLRLLEAIRILGLQKVLYRTGYLFYKKHVWFNKAYVTENGAQHINKKLLKLNTNCNIAKNYFKQN
jgi:hypothetical protein